jgi:hypothetical protein
MLPAVDRIIAKKFESAIIAARAKRGFGLLCGRSVAPVYRTGVESWEWEVAGLSMEI